MRYLMPLIQHSPHRSPMQCFVLIWNTIKIPVQEPYHSFLNFNCKWFSEPTKIKYRANLTFFCSKTSDSITEWISFFAQPEQKGSENVLFSFNEKTNIFIKEYYKNNIKAGLSIFESNEDSSEILLMKDKKVFASKINISSFENQLNYLKIMSFSLMATISYHYGNATFDDENKRKLKKLADFSIHYVEHSHHKESLFLKSDNYQKYIKNFSMHIERKINDKHRENAVDYRLDEFDLFMNVEKIENEIKISKQLNQVQNKNKSLRF